MSLYGEEVLIMIMIYQLYKHDQLDILQSAAQSNDVIQRQF